MQTDEFGNKVNSGFKNFDKKVTSLLGGPKSKFRRQRQVQQSVGA